MKTFLHVGCGSKRKDRTTAGFAGWSELRFDIDESVQPDLVGTMTRMTYLNDVDGGGTTFFSHYDLEIKPKKGLTLIWPAEWTHAHKGNVLHSGSKYIITGWMDLCI